MPSAAAPDYRRGSVSDLLAGVDLTGRCWCYTDLDEAAGFSVPPCEDAYVHAVLDGSVRLATAGGEMMRLGAGSVVIMLSGEAHAVRTCANSAVATHPLLRAGANVDVPPTLSLTSPGAGAGKGAGAAGNGGGRVVAHVLSGRLRLSCPSEMDRAALPAMVHTGLGAAGEDGPAALLLKPQVLALAGIGPGSAALLSRIATLMLVAALRIDPRCRRILAPTRNDPIAEALSLIERRPASDWTVASLARAVGMGRSNFAAQFTRTVGRAPMEVVVGQRMQAAAALLREGRLKIAEIGEIVGYGSEAAFSRRFTRHFGETPSRLREQARRAAREQELPPQPRRLLGGRTAPSAAASPGGGTTARPVPASLAHSSARPLMMSVERPGAGGTTPANERPRDRPDRT